MRITTSIAALLGVLVIAGCGDTRAQRVVTGAAAGAVAGQVIDDRPVEGAVVGGVIGAVR